MRNKNKNQKTIITTSIEINNKKPKKKKIPQTAQDTIPFDEIYSNGIFKVGNSFSLIYEIDNMEYKMKNEKEQDMLYNRYQAFLNRLPIEISYQEIIVNIKSDVDMLRKSLIPKENIYTDITDDYINLMENKINEAVNSSCKQQLLGVINYAPKTKLDSERTIFKLFDEIRSQYMTLGTKVRVLSVEEVLKYLFEIYHPYDKLDFLIPKNIFRSDLKLKDYISPSYFKFFANRIEIGNSMARVFFTKRFAADCEDTFLIDMLDNNYNITVSKHIKRIPKETTMAILRTHINDLEARMEKRRAVNHKVGGTYIPYTDKNKEKELNKLFHKMDDNNDLFELVILVMIQAKDKQELDDLSEYVKAKARNHQVSLDILGSQQEKALASVLPLGINNFNTEQNDITYHIPTDEIANFIPFSFSNYFNPNGLYYGVNLKSNDLIVIDRTSEMNANGFILGVSGSGKSMFTKSEMFSAMFKYPHDEFIVIDPEQEYLPLVESFNGEFIKLSPSSNTHINLFDTDLTYTDDGSGAVALKSEFIMTFVESAMGKTMSSSERTIADRAVKQIYSEFVKSNGDKSKIPTLTDYYNLLCSMEEKQAKDIVLSLELYVKGNFDIFAHKTNVEFNKKFLVFDIFDMGDQLRKVGLQVLLEIIWQRVIDNKKRGVRTWLWCDEFSVMFTDITTGKETTSSGAFFAKVYRRIRKHGGVATGITQNITEMLANKQAVTMLSNSEFLILTQQDENDLKKVKEIKGLSDSQLSYLATGDLGTGLIISGTKVIPFDNTIDKKSKMYEICNTTFKSK